MTHLADCREHPEKHRKHTSHRKFLYAKSSGNFIFCTPRKYFTVPPFNKFMRFDFSHNINLLTNSLRRAMKFIVRAFCEPFINHALVTRTAPICHGHDFIQNYRRHTHSHGPAGRLEPRENCRARFRDVAAGFIRRRHFANGSFIAIHKIIFLFCSWFARKSPELFCRAQ